MRNLYAANLSRLVKSRLFRICSAGTFCLTMILMLMGSKVDAMNHLGNDLDYYYFKELPFAGLLLSVFISLFLGTEFGDGTMRNKLVVGHTRLEIYFSNLAVCLTAAAAFFVLWVLAGLVGIPYFGLWRVGVGGFFRLLAVSFCTVVATTAILTALSQLISNKAFNAVAAIFLSLGLLLAASFFYNSLCEPEMTYSGITISAENGFELGDLVPNPSYVKGAMRTVYETMLNILPPGQQIWIADETVTQPLFMIGFSLAVTIAATVAGYLAFRKKDLK